MKKTLLLLVFIFTCAFTYNVNAATLTPRSSLDGYATNNVFDTTGIVDSDQRPQENFTYSSTLNTTYSRKLYGLRAYFNYSLTANHTYRLSINTSLSNFNWSAFNYANLSVCYGSSWSGANSNCTSSNIGFSILSADTIAFNFRPTSNYTYFSFRIGPQTMSEYPLTSSYQYRITSFVLDDLNAVPSSPSNNDVINNDNQNTTTILDRLNESDVFVQSRTDTIRDEIIDFTRQAEQNIINNQNSNNNALLENASCPVGPLPLPFEDWAENRSQYLKSDGSIGTTSIGISLSQLAISPYFSIKPSTEYNLSLNNGSNSNYYYCFYRSNKSLISCSPLSSSNITFTSPSNSMYFRFTMFAWSGATLSGPVCNDWQKEKLNDIDNSIDNINGYISDGNVSSSTGQNFFGNFQVDDFGISAIISAPLNAINSLTSATCSPLIIPIPFTNSNVSLPCMSSYYQSKVPELYQLWEIVSFGIISYYIINSIFGMIHNFREPDNDCVEVLDL